MNNKIKNMKVFIFFLCFFFSISAISNDMRNSSKEGSDIGRNSIDGVRSSIADFNPEKEFKGFTANPDEIKFKDNGAGLSNAGNKELSDSELGKVARDSFINNPKDKISWDSDLIQNSLNIKDQADGIVGGMGENCVKQVKNESYFTNHFCEKEETIKGECTRTATVRFIEAKKVEIKKYQIYLPKDFTYSGFSDSNGVYRYVIKPKIYGKVISASYERESENLCNMCSSTWFSFVDYLHVNYKLGDSVSLTKLDKFPESFDQNTKLIFEHPSKVGPVTGGIRKFRFHFDIEIETKTIKPEIVWVENCPIDKSEAVKTKEVCTQKGENRKFVNNGKTFDVYSDCWGYTEEWVINESDDNTCQKYENNANCTVGQRRCLLKVGNTCIRNEIKYQCQHTTKTEGYICGGKFYCDDGSCVDVIGSENNDFGAVVSQLASLGQAGKDVMGLDEENMRAFSGKAMQCRKATAGFSNCCKSSGWGNDIGLASCNSEEKAIGEAKEKNIVISIGTYCSKKVLGVCLQKKSSYCVFDNMLARIVQAQGRAGQLGVGFGSAKSPDCRGITINELQKIRFDHIDFSDFFDELNNNISIPDQDKLLNEVNRRMQDKFNDGKK